MTGKEFLQGIRHKRQKLNQLRSQYIEAEKSRQLLRGVNLERVNVSGGRVSSLDDEIERQEERRRHFLEKWSRLYLAYIVEVVKAYSIIDTMGKTSTYNDMGIMQEYYLFDVPPERLAKQCGYSPSYIRQVAREAVKRFSIYYTDTPP